MSYVSILLAYFDREVHCSQLLEIQSQFRSADASGSRIGIRGAQRKLELWDELTTKLDETMEANIASY